jgi:HK97 family phage prohead protease
MRVEHKSMTATDLGSFTGYLAVIGNRDEQGDTIELGALDATVAAFRAGRRKWFLTDAHSDRASDVVAEVVDARLDAKGLWVAAWWMDSTRAQELRKIVRAGARLGLSIDYFVVRSRLDDQGGRLLAEVIVLGGAITPIPANGLAVITEGKGGPLAPVVDVFADVQARRRVDPEREREDRMLAAASWPPPHWDRDLRLSLITELAELKAAREVDADAERARVRARWERQNAYSADLACWLAAHRDQQTPAG